VVACALADASAGPYAAVGVDVEWVRPIPDMMVLARDHFAEAEVRALKALPAARRQGRFFALWTLRQAWGKARCASRALEDQPLFTFDDSGTMPQAFFSNLPEVSRRWRFWLHGLDESHVLAIAARRTQALA
jgi:4'-phosphopantetheinyl transferase